jgi:hypothetical protein
MTQSTARRETLLVVVKYSIGCLVLVRGYGLAAL